MKYKVSNLIGDEEKMTNRWREYFSEGMEEVGQVVIRWEEDQVEDTTKVELKRSIMKLKPEWDSCGEHKYDGEKNW